MAQVPMADAEYYSIDRYSFSSLKYILTSPRKYLHQKQVPFRGNDATDLGNAIHLWLQGEKHLVFKEPDISHIKTKSGIIAKEPRMTDEGKKLLSDFKSTLPPGAFVIPHKFNIEQLEENFRKNPDIQKILSKTDKIEMAHLGDIQGLPFKAKCDFEGENCIVDLKTTGKGGDLDSFKHTLRSSHYDLQAAIYCTLKSQELGCSPLDISYYFVVCETFAPFEEYVYEVSQETLTEGLYKLDIAIHRLKNSIIDVSSHSIFNTILTI